MIWWVLVDAPSKDYPPWAKTHMGGGDGPYTVADVERIFGSWGGNYSIARITLPDAEADGFPAEYHSDVDGDRYVIVDAEDFDLAGWSVEVEKEERWYERAGYLPREWTAVREFSRTQRWYRSHKGSPWGHLRFENDEVDHPWSALVDHGESIARWIAPPR